MGLVKFLRQLDDLSKNFRRPILGWTKLMTNLEAYRDAIAELGDTRSEAISAFIVDKFGIVIAPQYIPLFRATLAFHEKTIRSEQPEGPSNEPTPPQNA